MDRRQQHGGRWNTGQLLRTLDESHFPDERRHAPPDSSNHSTRSFVSRFGMTDMSCFPSARSRRAFARTDSHRDELVVRRPGSQRRAQPRGSEPGGSSSRQEKGKSLVFPRAGRGGLVIRDNNELPAFTGTGTEERSSYFQRLGSIEAQSDSDDQVFDLPLVDESFEVDRLQVYRNPTETATNSRSSTKRKSYTGASSRGSASSSGGAGNKSREEQLRGLNLRRSSSSTVQTRPASMESHRPQKIRVSRRSVDVSSSRPSSLLHASGSGENSQSSSFNELITGHLDRQANSVSARRSSNSASRSRRSYQGNSSTDTLTRSLRSLSSSSSRPRASASAPAAGSNEGIGHRLGRTGPARSFTRAHDELTNANSHILSRRNISNCFPALGSQGRRSSSPRELGRSSGLPSSSSSGQASTSLLATAIDNVTSSSSSSYPSSGRGSAGESSSSSSSSQEVNWSSSFGWEYHRPRLMAEGLAKILMALERVETEDELTHEQLLMLEATVLFGGMALHDHHRDWRMDVDNMSYEELLDLGERIGNVNTGLTKDDISVRLSKTVFSSSESRVSRSGEENEIKCTICQEEYKDGEQLGWIDCGHQYHSECIRKWLVHKNICPICKATALS